MLADSGAGRRIAHDDIEKDVALPVIALSLFACFRSRVDKGLGSFPERFTGPLVHEFGGHAVTETRH